jgi:hypothetical protein
MKTTITIVGPFQANDNRAEYQGVTIDALTYNHQVFFVDPDGSRVPFLRSEVIAPDDPVEKAIRENSDKLLVWESDGPGDPWYFVIIGEASTKTVDVRDYANEPIGERYQKLKSLLHQGAIQEELYSDGADYHLMAYWQA